MIVQAAVQEDVDVVGLSILSGAHEPLARKVVEGLRHAGAGSIRVAVGGTIPEADVAALRGARRVGGLSHGHAAARHREGLQGAGGGWG